MRRAGEICVIALALALLTVIAAYSNRPSDEQYSVPSMKDSGTRGVAAWSILLRRVGLDVRAFTSRLTQLDADDTTMVLAGDGSDLVSPPTSGEMASLADWVRRGGHLILVGFALDGADAKALGLSKITVLSKVTNGAVVTSSVHFMYPVRRLRGSFNAVYAPAKHHTVLARTHFGILAERHALGRGEVVAIADTEVFDNGTLATADNARFSVAIFRSKRVLFDEAMYGSRTDRRFWDVLGAPMQAAVILACILAALAIAGNMLPFAPPLQPAKAAPRTSSGYVESLAQLLAAGGARTYAVKTFADAALQRVRGRSVRDGIQARIDELTALAQRRTAANTDVMRAAQLYAAIRKDVK
ncbi:MAG: DUF4350 domain-containing protein [Candidatus Eremiobacteraeota bacterium]|nr:DUF4350 domain-containing protein [Candidatus Eremiobacteraeota bacterium]